MHAYPDGRGGELPFLCDEGRFQNALVKNRSQTNLEIKCICPGVELSSFVFNLAP